MSFRTSMYGKRTYDELSCCSNVEVLLTGRLSHPRREWRSVGYSMPGRKKRTEWANEPKTTKWNRWVGRAVSLFLHKHLYRRIFMKITNSNNQQRFERMCHMRCSKEEVLLLLLWKDITIQRNLSGSWVWHSAMHESLVLFPRKTCKKRLGEGSAQEFRQKYLNRSKWNHSCIRVKLWT